VRIITIFTTVTYLVKVGLSLIVANFKQMALEDRVWKILSKRQCIAFGKECLSSALWTFIAIFIRLVLYFCRCERWVSLGVIWALPYSIQFSQKCFKLFNSYYPILSVRLAELILARSGVVDTFIVIPAHLLGAILGGVLFGTFIPISANHVLSPLYCNDSTLTFVAVIDDLISNTIYICMLLVLPYLLETNRLSRKLVSIAVLPIFFLSHSNFSPAQAFSLWFLSFSLTAENTCNVSVTRFVTPLAASILASWICQVYFPDDPPSWTRSRRSLKTTN